jgi:hypothetical protein
MTKKVNTLRKCAVVMETALVGFKFTLKQAATLGLRTRKNVDEALNDVYWIVHKHTH